MVETRDKVRENSHLKQREDYSLRNLFCFAWRNGFMGSLRLKDYTHKCNVLILADSPLRVYFPCPYFILYAPIFPGSCVYLTGSKSRTKKFREGYQAVGPVPDMSRILEESEAC